MWILYPPSITILPFHTFQKQYFHDLTPGIERSRPGLFKNIYSCYMTVAVKKVTMPRRQIFLQNNLKITGTCWLDQWKKLLYERGYLRTGLSEDFSVYSLYITFSGRKVSGIASNRFFWTRRCLQVPKTCSNRLWECSYGRSKTAMMIFPLYFLMVLVWLSIVILLVTIRGYRVNTTITVFDRP